MGEIRARAEKHIEAKEDLANRLQAEQEIPTTMKKREITSTTTSQLLTRSGGHALHSLEVDQVLNPKVSLSHVPMDVPLPTEQQLGPSHDEWCKFHHALGHTIENCWVLKNQIEKLIQDGYLG
ncbi:hypothetical protein CR513_13117, partial [Mucuna pruriens]